MLTVLFKNDLSITKFGNDMKVIGNNSFKVLIVFR